MFNVICCCDCNCYAAIATPTSSFPTVATTNALSLIRVPGQTATLPLLLLTSFATIATAIAYADATVASVAVLTTGIVRMLQLHIQKVIRCCDYNCYAAVATPTSSFATIATTNALSLLRVPGDTAALPLLLLTSFAAVSYTHLTLPTKRIV